MNLRDAQLQHEANLQDQYDRTQEDASDFRDYVLLSCTHDEDDGNPPLTDYFAFHDGHDEGIPIGHTINGEWHWGFVGNDFDERKSAEVTRLNRLLQHEVQRECQAWLLKRDELSKQLALTRAELVNVAAKYPSHVYAALALQASHLRTELKLLEAA